MDSRPYLASHRGPRLHSGPTGLAAFAAVRSARRVVALNALRGPLEQLSLNLRLNSARLVVERLRACHVAWCDRGQLLQAVGQAPDPPGCFDLILAAGMIEQLLLGGGAEAKSSGGARRSPPAEAAEALREGLSDALGTARRLVQPTQRSATLSTVTATAAGVAGGQAAARQLPPKATALLLLERRGVLPLLAERLAMPEDMRDLGWEAVTEQPFEELSRWLTGPSPGACGWQGPVSENLDVLILRPLRGT